MSAKTNGYQNTSCNRKNTKLTKKRNTKKKNVDNKTNIVIGINKHKDEATKNVETFNIDLKYANEQIKSLKTYKENRNNLGVNEKLRNLKVSAKSNDNIMPAILDCVRNQCTLGEISNTLRDIFGTHG